MSDTTELNTLPIAGAEALERYRNFMEVARNRVTTRQFRPDYAVPREHYEMILEAARHAPSGANAQPWHYIIVTDPALKRDIADYFVEEQRRRARSRAAPSSSPSRSLTSRRASTTPTSTQPPTRAARSAARSCRNPLGTKRPSPSPSPAWEPLAGGLLCASAPEMVSWWRGVFVVK